MAGSLQNLVRDQMADVTECSICREIFTNPKSLPCLHSFCLICLEKYGKDQKPGDQMVCPICRSSFSIPNEGFRYLPTNFFIGKMVEIRRLSSSSSNEVFCATCPEEEMAKANMFCIECEQNLCSRCGSSHKKIKLCQNHQVVEIGKQSQEITFRNSYCNQHPGEIVKMFCEDDKSTICILCFAESHQTHKCLSVTRASEELASALKKDLETVKRRLPECKNSLEKLNNLKISFLVQTTEAEKKILNEATRLKALIDSHANDLKQTLVQIKDKKLKEIECAQEDVERFQATIESYERYVADLLSIGAPGDICREAGNMKTKALELTAKQEFCIESDSCWDKIDFKSSNCEQFLSINNIANIIGNLETDPSNDQLFVSAKGVPSKNSMLLLDSKPAATGVTDLDKRSRTIIAQNFPKYYSKRSLRMTFGGEIETIAYNNGIATITFEESSVAHALASKGFVMYGHQQLLIKKWSDC